MDDREQARLHLEHGEGARALALLRDLCAREPDEPDVWFELGLALESTGDLAGARAAHERAVELDREHVPARRALAGVLDRLGKLDEAVFQLLRAVKTEPGDPDLQRALGTAYTRKGLHDKAGAAYRAALELAPDDARSHYGLGLAHEGRRDAAAAIASYRRAIALDPSFIDARLTLADTLAYVGEHQAAIGELDALLAIDRTNERAAQNREVLERALTEMRAQRLLGRPFEALEIATLVEEGQFRFKGQVNGVARWVNRYSELHAEVDGGGNLALLFLTMLDPDKASHADGDRFGVSVIGQDGAPRPADYATAATLTLLREGLGIPMTRAAELMKRLYDGEGPIDLPGTRAELVTRPALDRPEQERHGVVVRAR